MHTSAARTIVDPSLTVNDVLRRWPAAVAPLNALGIDSCCGGGASLREAADEAGIPLDDLLAAIESAAAPEGSR
jgi:iron-sulfur cluster repair protein YtfE (RIC family)